VPPSNALLAADLPTSCRVLDLSLLPPVSALLHVACQLKLPSQLANLQHDSHGPNTQGSQNELCISPEEVDTSQRREGIEYSATVHRAQEENLAIRPPRGSGKVTPRELRLGRCLRLWTEPRRVRYHAFRMQRGHSARYASCASSLREAGVRYYCASFHLTREASAAPYAPRASRRHSTLHIPAFSRA
jgi:hypothetical protein